MLLQNSAACLLKLDRCQDVEEVCNEALQIDGAAIKALNRRAQVI